MKIKSERITLLEQKGIVESVINSLKTLDDKVGLCNYTYNALIKHFEGTERERDSWKISYNTLGEFIPQFDYKIAKKYAKKHKFEVPELCNETMGYWWDVKNKVARIAYFEQILVRIEVLIVWEEMKTKIKNHLKDAYNKLIKYVQ